jgi:hypothetical protein
MTPADKPVDGELRERFTEYFDDLYQQWSIYGKYDKDKVVELLLNFIARQETAARIDELEKLRPSFVKTGYAGTHHVYQTGFDISTRIAELQNGASE